MPKAEADAAEAVPSAEVLLLLVPVLAVLVRAVPVLITTEMMIPITILQVPSIGGGDITVIQLDGNCSGCICLYSWLGSWD